MVTNNEVYATSGDGGHISAFDKSTFTLLGQHALEDARWVAWDEQGGRVVVAQGTPGRLSVFAEGEFPGGSLNLLNTFTFPGADIAESKSTVEIMGGKAFVAAGPEGVQIVCLDNGQVVGSVARPDPAGLGLDPSVVVTNAVSVDGDIMFISNGEAGVYVAKADEDFASSGCAQQNITMLGHLRFDNLQSANHVDYRNGRLVVAAGLGGVKVVEVSGL
jgi:outer membrane protein assembly factor BamB